MRSMPHPRHLAANAEAEPTPADLAAIEAEWPRIAADLAALDDEIRALTTTRTVDELAVRRTRRQRHATLRSAALNAGRRNGGEAA